ncbi:MAG: bifunctional acetate--CoA ligase family protein/GNAT family N-acetyltransferase [Gammaproteobacteria bacterium]|nr:bifunctional acetate--CoA ligase family protein/GNAT family N-acetyltransferase [Gammaproteobacteria bacterium]
MSTRNLDYLFHPTSVAVVGASNRQHSVGHAVMRNLLTGGFDGPIMPVNPKYRSVAGVLSYPDVHSLPHAADLAVICTPPPTLPGLIKDLGDHGTRAAIVITAGLKYANTEDGRSLEQAMLDAARPHLLRILGGNCLGILVPGIGLNASFAHIPALPGKVALIHQSGALCTALLDWATSTGIGFSHFVSIGDRADVDFGDTLDYLGGDPSARAILMYVEAISQARKFMSAARAAARNKPVILIKAGRAEEGARAAASHTGSMMGADEVYDAAFRRAGLLRVFTTREMFDAVETLASANRFHGARMAILTNGGGPGVIATDALMLGGGSLAELESQTILRLNEVLPSTWSKANPIDIIGDADGERYAVALKIVLADRNVDTVLVLHSPTAVVSSDEAAAGVVGAIEETGNIGMVSASWLGGNTVTQARRLLTDAGIPNYDTPDEAVRAFLQVVEYHCNQELLMQTPPSMSELFDPDVVGARAVIYAALNDARDTLSEPEAKAVLAAYGIPVVETRIARTPEEAERVAEEIDLPVALKVLAESISHKSDVGGVVLDLATGSEVRSAATAMIERVARFRPDVTDIAFTVQKMARRPGAHELIVGVATDPIFGPVIMFGEGGTAVEVIGDKAVALPPLNLKLARELIASTRVAKRLRGYRDRPPADLEAIQRTLVQIAQLAIDIPEIVEVDINPLLADEHGSLALDARIHVSRPDARGAERLAIRPYPKDLEERIHLDGLDLLLRPIRPEDEPMHKAFVDGLDPQDVRFRFFGMVREFPHSQMARLTQIDYDREMAIIATQTGAAGDQTVGVVRTVCDPDNVNAEFAIVVSSTLKGRGLGRALLSKMIDYCRARETQYLIGEVLSENERMLHLAESLGFELNKEPDVPVIKVCLKL